jgi:hypothetical protein
LFWTVPLRGRDRVNVHLDAGRARMVGSDVAVKDFFDIPNALFRFEDPVSVDATCSFDIHWSGPVTSRGGVTTPGTSGELLMCHATMTWSASNALGFNFTSDPNPTTSVFAQLGRVRNGVFADQEPEPDTDQFEDEGPREGPHHGHPKHGATHGPDSWRHRD